MLLPPCAASFRHQTRLKIWLSRQHPETRITAVSGLQPEPKQPIAFAQEICSYMSFRSIQAAFLDQLRIRSAKFSKSPDLRWLACLNAAGRLEYRNRILHRFHDHKRVSVQYIKSMAALGTSLAGYLSTRSSFLLSIGPETPA